MGDHAVLQHEGRVGRVVGVRLVGVAALVYALWNVIGAEAAHRLDTAEQIVEYVAPVAQHVEDDATAFAFPVIPARPLRGLPIAFEYPITELAAYREHAAEEAGIAQHPQLAQTGQEQLVLHNAVLELGASRELGGFDRLRERVGDRLFAINVLAGLD